MGFIPTIQVIAIGQATGKHSGRPSRASLALALIMGAISVCSKGVRREGVGSAEMGQTGSLDKL